MTSAVEEAGSASGKASELRVKLEAALAEQTETKMRLKSESAANEGLKAAVMEANEVCICMYVCVFFLSLRHLAL